MNLTPLAPDAPEAVFDELYALYCAAVLIDRPGLPRRSREDYVGWLKTASVGTSPIYPRVARRDGNIVAVAYLQVPQEENLNQAIVEIDVDPSRRRQGIGTDVLRALLPEIRATGRPRVVGVNIRTGSDSERWAVSRGLVPAIAYVVQSLSIPDTQPELWDVAVPAGYRIESWVGPAPEHLLDSLGRARAAIEDAPYGESSYEAPDWTAGRIRREEQSSAALGVESRIVVAVHEDSAEIVGVTEVWVTSPTTERGQQLDTAVLAAHRGHGLGRCIKAAMMRGLVADHPQLKCVNTQTSTENGPMIAVNLQLGYQTLFAHAFAESDLDDLEKRLAELA